MDGNYANGCFWKMLYTKLGKLEARLKVGHNFADLGNTLRDRFYDAQDQ